MQVTQYAPKTSQYIHQLDITSIWRFGLYNQSPQGSPATPWGSRETRLCSTKDKIHINRHGDSVTTAARCKEFRGHQSRQFCFLTHPDQIEELYQMMSRWDITAQQLPAIVSRLKALKTLHEQSCDFQQSLRQLESHQAEMKTLLSTNHDLLVQVTRNSTRLIVCSWNRTFRRIW